MKKRIKCGIVLLVLLVFCLVPMAVFADEDDGLTYELTWSSNVSGQMQVFRNGTPAAPLLIQYDEDFEALDSCVIQFGVIAKDAEGREVPFDDSDCWWDYDLDTDVSYSEDGNGLFRPSWPCTGTVICELPDGNTELTAPFICTDSFYKLKTTPEIIGYEDKLSYTPEEIAENGLTLAGTAVFDVSDVAVEDPDAVWSDSGEAVDVTWTEDAAVKDCEVTEDGAIKVPPQNLAEGDYTFTAHLTQAGSRLMDKPVRIHVGPCEVSIEPSILGKPQGDAFNLSPGFLFLSAKGADWSWDNGGYETPFYQWEFLDENGELILEPAKQGDSGSPAALVDDPILSDYGEIDGAGVPWRMIWMNRSGTFTVRFTMYHSGKAFRTAERTLTVTLKAPAAPKGFKAKAGSKRATLSWYNVSGAEGYKVYRSLKKTKGYKLVKTIKGSEKCSFVNKGLKKKKTYYYKVKAYRKDGSKTLLSGFSKAAKVKIK